MCRGCEGWLGNEKFKCFSCNAAANTKEGIEHGQAGGFRQSLGSPDETRRTLTEWTHQGFTPRVENGMILVPRVPCTPKFHNIRENPYVNEDGTEKPIPCTENALLAYLLPILILVAIFTTSYLVEQILLLILPDAILAYVVTANRYVVHWFKCNVLHPSDADLFSVDIPTDC